MNTIRIGTRGSPLARWQADRVCRLLQESAADVQCRTQIFVTSGDKNLEQPLAEIGGKGLFTAEIERALLGGQIDCAVHSLKDLPVADSPGLTLGAIVSRADPRDALVSAEGASLSTLGKGARVGTSSLRRGAQLLAARPDLKVRSIRGNVGSRVQKVWAGEYDAAILAVAGLQRLDLMDRIGEILTLQTMLPAPGQAALAVQCRRDDAQTLRALRGIDDAHVRAAVTAERAFLQALGGGCSAPIAAFGHVDSSGFLHLRGRVSALDGRAVVDVGSSGSDPHDLGRLLAERALAQGAGSLLDHA